VDLLRVEVAGEVGVRLRGELDAGTSYLLAELASRVPSDGDPLVLDLSQLTFIDASGVHSLAAVAAADPERRVVAASARPNVQAVLRLLTEALPPNLSVEAAAAPRAARMRWPASAARFAFARSIAETGAGIRARVDRRLHAIRRLRTHVLRTVAPRRVRAPHAPGSR
jgi:anti-anti-sigma factor